MAVPVPPFATSRCLGAPAQRTDMWRATCPRLDFQTVASGIWDVLKLKRAVTEQSTLQLFSKDVMTCLHKISKRFGVTV